jgi:hypothetical protein
MGLRDVRERFDTLVDTTGIVGAFNREPKLQRLHLKVAMERSARCLVLCQERRDGIRRSAAQVFANGRYGGLSALPQQRIRGSLHIQSPDGALSVEDVPPGEGFRFRGAFIVLGVHLITDNTPLCTASISYD